ncbi:hypothetical protein A1Q1_05765 [Trichosporon asahii var. asahii CBS 2479]|uniref:DUF4211 domain-containing protein n=1 Tax=Trichosporon asahii var. asahii (strain ATCC 90039 / CBS 2479 / JCM 2466 / KCTC 7840 / NBRC 103889/ NCYC 2677 / UAMH 7654) TaxID=1186058 RepID=J5SH74_TRIAS|nr:hypothetical protein A1Q1_05765 [Trichosporon asahii var. asahii CBS 2479]EJT45616.1 hypothetical protein A1Q1_05765 [Trichosporon asahii var. asahii CBS 2479]
MPTPSKLKQSRLTFSSWEPLRKAASERGSSQQSSPASSPLPPSSSPPQPSPQRTPPRSTQSRRTRLRPMKLEDSSEEVSDDDFNAVRLGPRSPTKPTQRKGRFFSDDEAPEPTARRRIASSDEGSGKNESSIEFLGSDPQSSPSKSKGKRKATRRRVDPDSDDSASEDEAPRRKLRPRRHQSSDSDSPAPRSRRSASPKPRKRRRSNLHPDPDDEPASAATEDEDARAEIEMDEPERFTATTRLRETKESAWAANLRRLKESRGGNAAEYVSSGSDKDEGDWAYEREDELDDFLVSDDGEMLEELPEEFSHKRESTEYKFKVVFQYLLLLAIKGPDILPLSKSNADYFGRQLRDVRNLMKGFRDSISSTLWKPEFRKALETYPIWKQADLTEREQYCDGCNRRNQHCYHTAWLRGQPYDRESHEVLDASDSEDAEEDTEDDDRVLGNMVPAEGTRLSRAPALGAPDVLLYQVAVQRPYMSSGEQRDLASRRRISAGLVRKFSRGPLPNDVEDVDEVTEWMDSQGLMRDSLDWLGRVEGRARRLERHY